jgi:hypothetical protein
MSANAAAPNTKAANAPAPNTKAANAPSANAPAKPAAGLLNGLFGAKKTEVSANTNKSALNQKNRNAANLVVKEQQRNNAKKAASGPGLMASLFGAPKNAPATAEPSTEAVAASLNKPAGSTRSRTRKQRGGAYRGKTMRLPGPRNVLRVTGKTVRKLRNVGVYGLKKVGNGVHMVTGLLGAGTKLLGSGTKLLGSVVRKGGKTLKGLVKRRQQTRRRS